MPELAPLDPERLVPVLAKYHVRYVLIGALAARLQGFPRLTADADITPDHSRDDLGHLSAARRELAAKVYTERVPEKLSFDRSASALARAPLWYLVTNAAQRRPLATRRLFAHPLGERRIAADDAEAALAGNPQVVIS